MHPYIKFILFWNDTLHVSDGVSVHQDFKILHTATGICQTPFALCTVLKQADSSICLKNACCCMYNFELLMTDGNTVRNV